MDNRNSLDSKYAFGLNFEIYNEDLMDYLAGPFANPTIARDHSNRNVRAGR